ncbi:TonB-dependent receptor, partial [Salmonella enterica]|nr:TonB-dependent receptor [Salmonella enterica]
LQHASRFADMMSREEFVDVVTSEGTETQKSLLGTADTDWNDEIFRTAFGTDNNLSIAVKAGVVPIRFSAGYYNQAGILDTDRAERVSGNLNVSPTLLDDHLRLNLGVKLSQNKNRFASTSAIWNAAVANPPIAVYKDYEGSNQFGGYNEALNPDGTVVTGANANPVGLLNQNKDRSTIRRVVGNFDAEYKLHPLPELKVHLTLGYDYAKGEGTVYVPAESFSGFSNGGSDYKYGPQEMSNKLLTVYANYNKAFGDIHQLDATAGYDYQMWKSTTPQYETKNAAGERLSTVAASDERHSLLSYYGRVNYTLLDRYMLTATMRSDGTSRFSKDDRWGTFPSVALAWRLSEEGFMEGVESLSNLKLRVSYGVTGQQEGIGNYGYLPVYTQSQTGANYQFGDRVITTYRPAAYVSDLTWETTKAWNFGVDFGFFGGRLNGSVEYYTRKTEDLLATVP